MNQIEQPQLDEHVKAAQAAKAAADALAVRIANARGRRARAGLDALSDEEIAVLITPKE